MLFSSTTFLFAFLPIVLITYYIVPRITRNLVLFIFSLVFYAWGEPVYIVLMIASTIVAYITGLLADKQRKNAKKYTPLIAMIGAVVWNIGLLLFFKYTDFFIGAANSIFGTQIKTLGLALPIGISFYSFQTLSYVIDVYKGEVRRTSLTLPPMLPFSHSLSQVLSSDISTLQNSSKSVTRA